MSTSSRTMMPGSLFGLLLFLRICLKNGVTDALPTCVILLRHTRHGARFNNGDAMAEGLTRRGCVSAQQSIQLAIRQSGRPASRATNILESSSRQLELGESARLPRTPPLSTLIPEPHFNNNHLPWLLIALCNDLPLPLASKQLKNPQLHSAKDAQILRLRYKIYMKMCPSTNINIPAVAT